MLGAMMVILSALWVLGALGGVGGGFVHRLLVVAAILLMVSLVNGRRSIV